MRDTLLIVAGDCGFGFEKPEYYKSIVKKNSARMSKAFHIELPRPTPDEWETLKRILMIGKHIGR